MKNIALALCLTILMVACSSGSTVSEVPVNATSSYKGTFKSNNNAQSGNVTLDIVEDSAGGISGNIIFQSSGQNCLLNAPISGNNTGFNISLTAEQASDEFTITTTIREPGTVTTSSTGAETTTTGAVISTTVRTSRTGTIGTTTSTNGAGEVTTVVTTASDVTGQLNIQLAVNNGGSNLSGTYTSTGSTCSNQTGSGTMNLSI